MNKENKKNSRTIIDVAVIGMAGRFPGAKNIDELWDNLKKGVESVSFFSEKELEKSGVTSDLIPNPNYVSARGILEGIEYFDAAFFGYTPVEAEIMNPQIRFFHECAWEALENAGYDPDTYDGLIGVYAGASSDFFWRGLTLLAEGKGGGGYLPSEYLINKDFLTTRLSYKLNLKGPSSFVQTACSTSLVAIHWASRAVLSGECHIALAGGVNIALPQKRGYMYTEGMVHSPDGHCRAFDAKAAGTVDGNGVGIVVLKRLKNAIADRDHINAVIKGSAINNDGNRKVGYTAPSVEGQADTIRTALAVARVKPESIGYLETHGTGTTLGDPIEIEGLNTAFNTIKKRACPIGSIKTNFGHLDVTAGVAGFIKTVLALKHKLIPPSLHFEASNPAVDFTNSPFYVNTHLTPWQDNGYPLRAAVSSFGIGGTNAHVVLEEWPDEPSPNARRKAQSAKREYQLLLLSAKTQTSLDQATQNLVNHFKQNPGINLPDSAYTLQLGRKAFEYRRMLVCADIDEAVNELSSPDSRKVHTFCAKVENRPVVFLFPGLGSQYVNMGLDLYLSEPLFRDEMDRCFEILKSLMKNDIKEILYPLPGSNRSNTSHKSYKSHINQLEIAQVVIFIFEYALAKLLMAWGITPQAMIGYSLGEYTAACLAGVFSLENALKLIVTRGQLVQNLPPGIMLSVPLSREELKALPDVDNRLSLSIDNGLSCIVSGPTAAVETFEKQMKEKGLLCVRLQGSRAIHSNMMEPILKEFEKKAGNITLNPPQIPYISNVTGTWIKPREAVSPAYWAKHLRETVQFSTGMNQLIKQESVVFVEIGPGRDLSSLLARYLENNEEQHVVNLVRHPEQKIPDDYYLLDKVGRLWLYGKSIDWSAFYSQEERHRIPLPTYPFDKQYYWIEGNPFVMGSKIVSQKNVLTKKEDTADWFYIPSWKRSMSLSTGAAQALGQSWWLMFIDECGLGAQLVKHLENEGQDVVIVRNGRSFSQNRDREYTINSQKSQDYQALFSDLDKLGKLPNKILHLWNVNRNKPARPTIKSIKSVQNQGFFSLIYLAKAIGKLNVGSQLEIEVVTTNIREVTGEEILCPEKTTLLGPVKVIPQEYPYVVTRSIDIVLPARRSLQEKELIHQLVEEFTAPPRDVVVAYRGSHRWVETYEAIRFEEPAGDILRLREEGVYLITGGLGGIGFTLAEFLAREYRAGLILTGRSVLPPRNQWDQWLSTLDEQDPMAIKIGRIKALEQLGGKVLTYSADSADPEQMHQVITRAEERLGNINGVIHAAGITGGASLNFISETSIEECQEQFQPKVYGLLVLENILKNKKIDFCLLTSSLSPILGGLGLAAYSAANVFMDAFVHWHNRMNRERWISINWADWQLAKKKKTDTSIGASVANLYMTPAEGIITFQRILHHCNANQVVVSTGDLQTRIDQWVNLEALRGENETHREKSPSSFLVRPNLLNPYVPPTNPIEQHITKVWQKLLGYEQIGVHDNFFELGGDSLKAITLISQIKEKGYSFSLNDILTHPTAAGLAALVPGEDGSKDPAPDLCEEEILEKLECIEKLNKGNNKKNIFIIHAMHGMVNQYKELAVLLEKNFNVYGIQAAGLAPGTIMAESPGKMLKQYLEQIAAVQPTGPYIIAGYCAGTIIGFGLVRKMEELGHPVEKLILFDTFAFSDKTITRLRIQEYLPGFVKKMILSANEKKFKKAKLKNNPPDINTEAYPKEKTEEDLRKEKVKNNINLLIRHILPLSIIKAPILVPLAEESNYPRATEKHFGKITKSSAKVIKTPGDHDAIFERPYVENLARILKNM